MMNYYIIPGFTRYQINAAGTIKDTKTGSNVKPIENTKHKYYLVNDTGKGLNIGLKRVYNLVFNREYCIDTIEDLPGEEWKPIAGTKEKYFVSNKGRVKSLYRYEAKILKPFDNGNGYQQVEINGRKVYLHRLVACAFLGNPEAGKDTTHHRNHNRKDNSLDNLQWLSLADNVKEAHARRKESKEKV